MSRDRTGHCRRTSTVVESSSNVLPPGGMAIMRPIGKHIVIAKSYHRIQPSTDIIR
jgi:hypothetical protein